MREIGDFMDLEGLNKEQRIATEHIDGPLLILAGAGTGKTRVMTHRIAYLVENGVSPFSILAVTFTNKAAKEMRERVESLIGDCSMMWISTIHSMCVRILRTNPEPVGYTPNFVIYDSHDQKTLIKSITKDKDIDEKKMNTNYFLSIISNCKERNMSPDQFLARSKKTFTDKIIYEVYSEYEQNLKNNNAMDFDDLLLNTYKLLQKEPDILEKYQEKFKYVLVDEYQDTNHLQYMIIKMLAEGYRNICVVGDDDQCIYEWRGADIRNILDFEKDFKEAKVIKLEQNYRSTTNILEGAHSVVKNNRARKDKKVWTSNQAGEKIKYAHLGNEKEEADFICNTILSYIDKGRKYSDFAVLYRVNAQSQALEKSFANKGIPYRVLAGLRYYDRKEIKDMLSYMKVVVNPKDTLSLKRIIKAPKRGIGDKTVGKLEALAKAEGRTLYEVMADPEVIDGLSQKASKGVKELMEALELCRQEKDNLRVSDIYEALLDKTGYLEALTNENTIDSETRIENLLEFKSVIYDYESEAEEPTLDEFMETITLMADVDNHDEKEDAVVLMTLHSAKGLEFPVVFMPGMEDGLFPSNKGYDQEKEMEEERRLCYVGMTRAKEILYMTGTETRMLFGKTNWNLPSIFLKEIDKKVIEGDPIDEGKVKSSGFGQDGYANKTPFKPFDPLKYAKESLHKETDEFAVGDRVSHGKFGQGTVLAVSEKIIEVEFDDAGTKKMALGIAPLKRI